MLEETLYNEIWKRKSAEVENYIGSEGRIFEALETIGRGKVLLDIGCGNGVVTLHALKNYEYVIGTDISLKALTSIPPKTFPVLQSNLNRGFIPLKDKSVDSVICLDVIEHLYDPLLLIKEIHRILRVNGELVVTTPNSRFIKHITDLLLRGTSPKTNLDKEGYDGGHLHYFTFTDMKKILTDYDFQILQEKGISVRFYNSLKLRIFYFLSKLWEKDPMREFFCQGIMIKAKKT